MSVRWKSSHVFTYHGTPYTTPSSTVVHQITEREPAGWTVADAATRESSRTSPSSATNSGTHVLPSWATSGVALPTYAVSSFSCAAVQGICCTRTRMPGFSRSNAGISSATTSPSRPSPQKSSTTPPAAGRQPARAAMKTAATRHFSLGTSSREFTRDASQAPAHEPPAREPRPAQPARDVRVGTQQLPHEPRAVVLGHREHRSFIDAEVIGVEPAELRIHPPLGCLSHRRERRVECVEETVRREQVHAVLFPRRIQPDVHGGGTGNPRAGGSAARLVRHRLPRHR